MSGFTPGPWFVDEYIPKDRFNAVHQHVGVCDGSGLSVVALCGPAGDEQSQKDAFLIAASPVMYEYILKKANEGDVEAAKIISAIAKTDGPQSDPETGEGGES